MWKISSFSFIEWFRNLNLHTKIQITIFSISTVIQALLAFTSYYQGRALLEQKSFELLQSVTENRKDNIQAYFSDIQRQISSLAQDPSIINAVQEFDLAYQTLSEIEGNSPLYVKALASVNTYYKEKYIPDLKYYSLNNINPNRFVISKSNSYLLQYFYIANNPNPTGYKSRLLKIESSEKIDYDQVHQKYHPFLKEYIQTMGFSDLYLMDLEGNIVYSVSKHVDFSTNLVTGPFRNSNLARIYRSAQKNTKKGAIKFADYEHYYPDYYQPASFVATPIYQGNQIIGTLAFRIPYDRVDNIISSNKNWEENGLYTSGEVGIIGQDFKVRNNTRSFLTNPLNYYTSLKNNQVDSVIVERIRRLQTTILLRGKRDPSVLNALNGKSGQSITKDYRGNEVLDVYTYLDVYNTRWAIITEIDATEIFAAVFDFRNQLIRISIFIFIAQTLLGYLLARGLSRPMLKIRNNIKTLSTGKLPKISSKQYQDELGDINVALRDLVENTKRVSSFAENIGQENYDYEFTARGESDVIGNSLLQMRDSLKKNADERFQRNWVNSGRALFNEILRVQSDNLTILSQELIKNFVKYLNANQGAFFYYQEETNKLELLSTYAYDRLKFIKKELNPGEEIVGQVFQETQTLYLKEIPEDYGKISSGLGQAQPKTLLFLPIKTENKIYGVIELASFQEFKDFEIEFLESIAENIATTLNVVTSSEKTISLLEESRQKSKQLMESEKSLLTKLNELEETKSNLEKNSQKMKENEEILKNAFKKMKEQETFLKENLEELERVRTEMQEKQEEVEKAKEELEKKNRKMRSNRAILREAFSKLRQQEEQMSLNIEGHKNLQVRMKNKITQLEEEKEILEQQNQAHTLTEKELRSMLLTKIEEVNTLKEKLTENTSNGQVK